MIYNLQTLRALAASGVVFYHSHATLFGKSTEFHGVALFFILSGYLMSRVCNRPATTFLYDRFWRIVPNYWFATALMLGLFNMWTYWPLEHTILSLFFIPHNSPAGLHPVLGVGWTLNMEVYFYSLFALAIFLNRKFAPIITALIIFSVWAFLPYFSDNDALIYYYAHSYIWYFIIGIIIWYSTEFIKKSIPEEMKLPKFTFPFSLLVYFISTLFFDTEFLGVTALFFVSILASNHGADLKSKLLVLLGNSSYACYLLHTIFIEFLRHKGIATSGTALFAIGVILCSWALAIIWYFSVEKLVFLAKNSWQKYGLTPIKQNQN